MPERLCAQDLSVRRGTHFFLKNINITLHSGELCVLLGPNGSGKSTLLQALAGLLPVQGTLSAGGIPLRSLSPSARVRWVAYLPQAGGTPPHYRADAYVALGAYPHLGPFAMPDRATRTRAHRLVAQVLGEQTAGRCADCLSGGELRLLMLCRTQMTGASVLLCDEPTAGLDFCNRYRVYDRLQALTEEGAAVLCAEHDPTLAAAYATRIFLLGPDRALRCVERSAFSEELPSAIGALYGMRLDAVQAGRHFFFYPGGEERNSSPMD